MHADAKSVVIDNFDEMTARINHQPFVKNDLANAGVSSLCVSYDGDVYPSAAFVGVSELNRGSVFKTALGAILSESPVAVELRQATVDKKTLCHSCEYKFLCGGGDIEHSFFHSQGTTGTGSVLGADPYCDVYKSLISDSFSRLAVEKGAQFNKRSGFDAPIVLHAMGDESVQSFMSEAVATVDIDTTIGKATREMLRNRIHHLPVVDATERLIGIISTMDILAEFADGAPD